MDKLLGRVAILWLVSALASIPAGIRSQTAPRAHPGSRRARARAAGATTCARARCFALRVGCCARRIDAARDGGRHDDATMRDRLRVIAVCGCPPPAVSVDGSSRRGRFAPQRAMGAEARGSEWNVYVLSASLFVLFAGYNTSQELAPKLLGNSGRIIVAVFYCSATVVGPLVPVVVRALGKRAALFLSGLAYVAYVGSLSYLVLPLSVALSVVLGVAAAVLFTVGPAEVNCCVAPERRGWANSLTWASLRMSAIPGNLVALWLLQDAAHTDESSSGATRHGWTESSPIFVALSALCLAGAVILLLMQIQTSALSSPVGGKRNKDSQEQQKDDGFIALLNGGLGARNSIAIRSLLPLFFFSGLNIGLIYGCLPALMPVLQVPKVYIVIAAAEVLGSVCAGRLADTSFGSSAVLWISFVIEGAAVLCVCAVANRTGGDDSGTEIGSSSGGSGWWYVAAALLGLADAGFQSQAYTVTGACFSDALKVNAFAVFGVLQHLGLAAAWVAVSIWPPSDSVACYCAYWAVCATNAVAAVLGSRRALSLPDDRASVTVERDSGHSQKKVVAPGASLCDSLLFPDEQEKAAAAVFK